MDHCIICDQIVRPRQEALLCDGCERWQHRTCQTGISQLDYREAVRSGEAINWHCEDCERPPLNSTPVLFSDGDFQSMVTQSIHDASPITPPEPDYDASLVTPPEPPAFDESSLLEPSATDAGSASFKIEFEIVEDSTKRGRNKLVDSRGYTYNVKRLRGGNTDWQCTVRPKGNVCKATVVERASGELILGPTPHNHPGQVGAGLAARITAKTKKEAVANLFKPASAIVNNVLMEELTDEPCPSLPKPVNLAKAANHLRQRLRPADPVDLEFQLKTEHIPENFLRGDIKVRGRRHLIFASQKQLEVLCSAKVWYIDGTFKLCRKPFSQLLTINAFVRSDSCAKQIPLLFAIMSGRKKSDYKAVLKAVLQLLPTSPSVKRITLDYERAVWSVIRKLMPTVTIQGCCFHWTQALWRKVQELGLQSSYYHDQGTYQLLRKFMALPFLPADAIPEAFCKLKRKAATDQLKDFATYVEQNWIVSNTWPPSCWSVYLRAIRTNNDVEGWHNGLNRRAHGKSQLPLYMLIELLYAESRLTTLQIRMVSEHKLCRIQRRTYRQLQAKIFSLWDQYQNGDRTTKQLLRACSELYGPRDV